MEGIMDRSFRFRVSGMVFFIITILHLVVTTSGRTFIISLGSGQDTTNKLLLAIIPSALVIFTSDAIGYIFSSIFQYYFNYRGGYAKLYKQGIGNLKKYIIDHYNKIEMPLDNEPLLEGLSKRLKKYNTEQFLIYYFWHRPGGADENLHKWIERRFNAYFTAYSVIIALILGTILSFSIICCYLAFNCMNGLIFLISILIALLIRRNGENALKDAVSITDLHISGFINPRVKEMVQTYISTDCFANNQMEIQEIYEENKIKWRKVMKITKKRIIRKPH